MVLADQWSRVRFRPEDPNVAEAYTFLMHHWRPGDELYIFGFSRGAYTARALVGMLNRPGLLRPGSENLGS
jgi:uncharacterized protein (DUF2235 family)